MITAERARFLSDVLITAVEGGISYWAVTHAYQWSDENPYSTMADIEDEESDEEPKILSLTIQIIETAFERITAGSIEGLHDSFRGQLIAAGQVNDAGLIDSSGADCIVQVGMFGSVVYG